MTFSSPTHAGRGATPCTRSFLATVCQQQRVFRKQGQPLGRWLCPDQLPAQQQPDQAMGERRRPAPSQQERTEGRPRPAVTVNSVTGEPGYSLIDPYRLQRQQAQLLPPSLLQVEGTPILFKWIVHPTSMPLEIRPCPNLRVNLIAGASKSYYPFSCHRLV